MPLTPHFIGRNWTEQSARRSSAPTDCSTLTGCFKAHLDGLVVAWRIGWQRAQPVLERWKKSGEAFVCNWPGPQSADAQQLDQLLPLTSSAPEQLLREVTSAFGLAAPYLLVARAEALVGARRVPGRLGSRSKCGRIEGGYGIDAELPAYTYTRSEDTCARRPAAPPLGQSKRGLWSRSSNPC